VFAHSSLDPLTVTVRACSNAAEELRSLEIYNEVCPRRAVTPAAVEGWKQASIASVEFLGAVDGVDAGSAAAAVQTVRPNAALVLITVLPQLRQRGVGRALFDAASTWAMERGVQELETPVEADDEESLRFALRRGYRAHSVETGLELDLSTVEPASVDSPPGVEIVSLLDRPELAAGAYEVAIEALPDIPGNEDWKPPPLEQFVAAHLQGLAIVLAVAGGEVVGYAKLHARPDGRTAEHGMTAVKRAWRGRGIAKALKRAQIAWAKTHGIERLTASNEERNAPMQHVNAALGYLPAPGRVHLRAPLRAGSPLP
jgi:GNAT superfamily N-acetyltransferase